MRVSSPPASKSYDFALTALASILTDGKNSRLQRRLVYDEQVAQACAFLASPAAAQDEATEPDDDEQVVLTGGIVVPEGETVGTVVVFNGPVVIEGTVTDSVVGAPMRSAVE